MRDAIQAVLNDPLSISIGCSLFVFAFFLPPNPAHFRSRLFKNTRYRHRSLDMLINRRVVDPFYVRSRILASLRSFLQRDGFVEVETPILWTNHGGANAKPFETRSNALSSSTNMSVQDGSDSVESPSSSSSSSTGLPLYLRIAPELFLKQCIIGGMEKVFEVSKVFRNEGMDATHNPEFTTVEFYQAWTNYNDLMQFTQDLFQHVTVSSIGRSNIPIKNRYNGESVVIDFSEPFARIDVMDGLKSALNYTAADELPDPNNEESIPFYLEQCHKHGISVGLPHTLPRLLDALIGHFLEPQCIRPTFLLHHPLCMSPLARTHSTRPGLTERFELFINGQEYVNAYSELNDPKDQLRRMEEQAKAANEGDQEAQPVDQQFCGQEEGEREGGRGREQLTRKDLDAINHRLNEWNHPFLPPLSNR